MASKTPTPPLESEKYFASPLATILESVSDPQSEVITLHDLTEAYATLSCRVRLQSSAISSSERAFPAFIPLQAENHSLSICLIRDIGRCLLNPLLFSQPESASDDSSWIEEGTERALAYATLSHHALVFLSDVFSFISLAGRFSVNQLSDLLRELLLILSAPHLPTPSSMKTWSLASWALISQRLHPDVWLPHKSALKKVLLRLVKGTFEGQSLKTYGFKLLSNFLRILPSEFVDCTLQLYPHILSSTFEDETSIKFQALQALRSIAAIRNDLLDTKWSRKLASETNKFVKSQGTPLYTLLESAMSSSGTNEWDNKGPLWSLLFIACLIRISDTQIFLHPRSLRLVTPILARAATHERAYIRALHPHVWKCLVWCYSHLPNTGGRDPLSGRDLEETREKAFNYVKQELKTGIPTALVALVLSKGSPAITKQDIHQALGLIKETLASNKESQVREGVSLLSRLLSSVGAPSKTSESGQDRSDVRAFSDIVVRDLFVGSFLDLPENQMRALSMHLPGPDERFVRPLTEDQIKENWEELVELWVYAVGCTRVPSIRFKHYEDELMNIWQSLLLIQSHLTSNSQSDTTHLFMSPTTSNAVTSTVTRFLKAEGGSSTQSAEEQAQDLILVHRLWSVMKHCYDTTFLVASAETLLATILPRDVMLADRGVKGAWVTLCHDLLAVIGKPEALLLSVFARGSEEPGVFSVALPRQRQLWLAIADSDLPRTYLQGWEDILSFLVFPIQLWVMDAHEVEVWNRKFTTAIEIANASSGTPHDTLNALFRKLSGDIPNLKNCPSLISLLLPHLHFTPTSLLHLDFLGIANELLMKMYPPTPEDHVIALPILEGLGHVVKSCEGDAIVRMLAVLKDGLGFWIKDEVKTLLDSEHASIVRSIYCASLDVLSTLPPSLQTLQTLSSFLTSSFERMGHPPIGPLAFEQYWRNGGYHDQDSDTFKKLVPEELKTCLKAWSDYCGDSLAEGCTSALDSQSTPRSIEPDSQSPDKLFVLDSEDYGFGKATNSDDEDIYDLIAPSSDLGPPMLSLYAPIAEMPRESTPRPSIRQRQATESPVFPEVEAAVGHKRSSSEGGDIRSIKRRKTDEADVSFLTPTTRHSYLTNLKASSNHHSTPRQPQPGPSRPRRRLFVSPTPPGEDFVPGTSSPAGPISPSPASCPPNQPVPHEDEVVDDSMETDLLSGLVHKDIGSHNSNKSNPSSFKRLQSEPVIDSHLPSRRTPLKRNHTTSERLGALQRAYSLLAESQGTSQVPLDELAHAAQIVHQMGAKIAEQMSKKLPELKQS
ncbi:hypothetical protein NP233_g6170 [Leucocoprinus birnbaumii]|uniref:Telomere-associated protein Rif1 N-terminal domain-containing protein n=1 Tax=Leucocoprinus birnbaumii TaxID=56174 RepID=A0AAD5YTW7_9AGAR|nr:hypothetical protein NP233_g6170 [Leucocoprinus birnbaumii]